MLTSQQPGRTTDNICGAVSRMIMAKRSAVPLDKVRLSVEEMRATVSQANTELCYL